MKLSDIREIHRKLDLILRTLGVDPDTNKPQGVYCVIDTNLWLFYRGDYYACLEYLDSICSLRLNLVTLEEYNRLLLAAGYEPLEI